MRRHVIGIAGIWIVLTVILEVLVAVLPIPSPIASDQALGEHQTVYMLFYVAVPFFTFIWAMLIYTLITFRWRRGEGDAEGPPLTDSTPALLMWAGISFVTVIFLAGWGTFTLHEITQPAGKGKTMHIQVIGQEWFWTYRYPSYGGAESKVLVLPMHRPIEFDITSLDVTHSLWIYGLDIKEDAVPGVVNHAFLYARYPVRSVQNGQNWVVCNELCGLYHGYMRSRMKVVSHSAFKSWATALETRERNNGLLKLLPKYHSTYFPPPVYPGIPQDQPT